MKLFLDIKPCRATASRKDILVEQITRGYCPSFGTNGNCYRSFYRGDEKVRMFNLVKHNRKVVQIAPGKHKVVQRMYWEAFYYTIPLKVLEVLKLKVDQGKRNFTISNR